MKLRLHLLTLLAFLWVGTQAQMTELTITLDAKLMSNPDCWMGGGTVPNNKAYLHSGLCSSNSGFCNDSVRGFGSPVWEHVVGNWGLDDGVGEMNYNGNGIWMKTIMVESYYSMPNGETPYTIGLVFRDGDGTNEGKDDQCGDIFIVDINTPNPRAISGNTGLAFSPVTVTKTTVVNVDEIDLLSSLKIAPNPVQGQMRVNFELHSPMENFSAAVYSVLGEKVAVLASGKQHPGQQQLIWNTDSALAGGVYYLVLADGERRLATEKIVLMR